MITTPVLSFINNKEQFQLSTNTLQIEICAEDLLTLLANRQLAANQVKCLNSKTKSLLHTLLLESCF